MSERTDRERLYDHLASIADTKEPIYTQSRKIANEIDLSTKQIGAHLYELNGETEDFVLSKFGQSKRTTWCVKHPELA